MAQLSTANLGALPDGIARPSYDRSELSVGIFHFGVGGFHRAHQAVVIDDLLRQGEAQDWAICGVGVLEQDRRMRDVLRDQDYLYTVVERAADGSSAARVVGSLIDFEFVPDGVEPLLARLASSEARIVSLTVTEGGYNINPVTGAFDLDNPAVRADLAQPEEPSTVFGIVVEALRRRREAGLAPFTVMSCDNLQDNGRVARRSFVAYARARDEDLAEWIEQNVAFPNSMVDRITPVTTDADRAAISADLGLSDGWPVVCEPFFQWVLEETSPELRPPYEDARVQVVADVEPYELMKLRLLNASHQALAYFAHLLGYRLVHDAAEDPLIARFLRAYMDLEATPTLHPVPGIDLDAYKRELIERFANANVRDTVARLAAESSDRIPKWLVPVIQERLAAGESVLASAAICASWARYAEGVDEQGAEIIVVDRLRDVVMGNAARQAVDPLAFVRDRDLFGDLVDSSAFTEAFTRTLDDLHRLGARVTLERILVDLGR